MTNGSLRPTATPLNGKSSSSSSTLLSPELSNVAQQAGRPSSQANPSSKPSISTKSDDAVITLIRRTLCSQTHSIGDTSKTNASIEESLPPLTSSNDIDLQLYALIAIIIKDYVYSWYSRFTSDHAFVDEVIQIIAHCTRSLEERIRTLDIETLMFREVPQLLSAHVSVYRIAQRASEIPSTSPRAIYHSLRPHPALSPTSVSIADGSAVESRNGDQEYRQMLAQSVLAVLLPTEDLQNSCLRAFVSDVLADLVLGQIVAVRLCDPLYVYEFIRIGADTLQPRINVVPWAIDNQLLPKDRLKAFGLLKTESRSGMKKKTVKEICWQALQYAFLGFAVLRIMLLSLINAPASPRQRISATAFRTISMKGSDSSLFEKNAQMAEDRVPLINYEIWPCVGQIVQLDAQMPWLCGLIALVQHFLLTGPGSLGMAGGRLDRALSEIIFKPLDGLPQYLPGILRNLRTAVFPGNAATLRQSSSTDPAAASIQTAKAKRAAAFAILNTLPQAIARLYFATKTNQGESTSASEERELEQMIFGIEEILDIFHDEYMNRHLVYSVMELCVAKVVPELLENGVQDLLGERGIDV